MRRFLPLAALAALVSTPPAHAADKRLPDPVRQEAARMLDAGKLFATDTTFKAAPRVATLGYRFPDDFLPETVEAMRKAEAIVLEKAAMPFRETIIDIYAGSLTPEQLKQAATFMESPAGQARAAMIQRQAVTPELSWTRVFTLDKPLRDAVARAAKERGLVLPK